ncbi:hypothetical protein FRX31_031031 [Thalictrum thalictroides]|uniref:Uncharacterized protein n=1 Tax=Thalictrum thalictroides TaxID=46969 RepID=A0A7J6V4Q9_THATH|nr:hypothetical protein FRX31_031031 [Thalictrum thalictroides]
MLTGRTNHHYCWRDIYGEIIETILPMIHPLYYQTLESGGAVPVTIETIDETILDGMILKKNEDGEFVLLGTWINIYLEGNRGLYGRSS